MTHISGSPSSQWAAKLCAMPAHSAVQPVHMPCSSTWWTMASTYVIYRVTECVHRYTPTNGLWYTQLLLAAGCPVDSTLYAANPQQQGTTQHSPRTLHYTSCQLPVACSVLGNRHTWNQRLPGRVGDDAGSAGSMVTQVRAAHLACPVAALMGGLPPKHLGKCGATQDGMMKGLRQVCRHVTSN